MAASSGFQALANTVPAPGVEGDFASLNPMYFFPAGPGGMVAGDSLISGGLGGVLVGRFAWPENNFLDPDNAPTVVNNFGSGAPMGLITRRQTGLITLFLNEAALVVPTGLGVSVCTAGDLWVVNRGTTQALIGQKVYANFSTGAARFGASGSPTTGASSTSSGSLAAATSQVTGSITGNVLTVTAVGSGTLYLGTTLSGTAVASGTKVAAQLSGTRGGIGTYALNIGEQTVAAGTVINGTYGLLTLGTVTSGPFAIGNVLTGTGVTAGSVITDSITGGATGGTMVVDPTQVVSGQVISVSAVDYETPWYAQSSGAAGEIVKISRLP